MRITIELPDALFREVKTLAARRGRTMKEIVFRAVEKEITKARPERKRYEVKLPLLHSQHPGILRSMTNTEIEELLG